MPGITVIRGWELEAAGCSEEVLGPLKKELNMIKIADLEAQIQALANSVDAPKPATKSWAISAREKPYAS